MSVVLSDNDFETIMKALLNAEHEFAFIHGLHVTDLPDVEFTFDLDCSQADKLIYEAIEILDNLNRGVSDNVQ